MLASLAETARFAQPIALTTLYKLQKSQDARWRESEKLRRKLQGRDREGPIPVVLAVEATASATVAVISTDLRSWRLMMFGNLSLQMFDAARRH